jgi:putative glycosyltransferase (TIGR04348 family)
VALTGTDLYPDITQDPLALRSLTLARSLVVLQDQALKALPDGSRSKARVILQSCRSRQTLSKSAQRLRVVVVGHLREEKNPRMLWRALRQIPPDAGIHITHIGHALDPALAHEAQSTASACPHYRWLQGCSHNETRRHIQRAHLLVHPSRSEGGAIVLSEAIRSGTPVLATRIDGNVGLLGTDYAGLVEPDDADALALRLLQCRISQAEPDSLLARWQRQCSARARLFDPVVEQAALEAWISSLQA